MTATVVFCVVGWTLGWVAFGRPRTLAPTADPAVATPGSRTPSSQRRVVVIPARNEAANIVGLLTDLTTAIQATHPVGAPRPVIVVVDDHSSDETATLAASVGGVVVMAAPNMPEGWTGKSWACWNGVAAAQRHLGMVPGQGGDLLLVFIDADVRLRPGALDAVAGAQHVHGGLMSVQPRHLPIRPYEQLSALFNVIAVMGVGAGHSRPPAGAFGPVLATTLDDYQRVGEHRSVRGEVAEDLALARRYRMAGLPVTIRLGEDLIGFRMYPKGLRSLLEGWTKNFCTGAITARVSTLAATALWVAALGSATFGLVDAVAGTTPVLNLGIYLAFVGQLAVMLRRVGRFSWWTPLLYPVGLATFFGVFARSTWRTLGRRSATWSGRTIDLTRSPAPVDAE